MSVVSDMILSVKTSFTDLYLKKGSSPLSNYFSKFINKYINIIIMAVFNYTSHDNTDAH